MAEQLPAREVCDRLMMPTLAELLSAESGDEEDQKVIAAPPSLSWGAKLLLSCALLLASTLALLRHGGHAWPPPPPSVEVSVQGSSEFMEVATVESGQTNWQIVSKERDLCSTKKENCIYSKCCRVSGHHCFGVNDTVAQCMKYCDPEKGNSCTPLSRPLVLVPDYARPARSLYCFSVYTANTGSPKPSHEKELLAMQFARRASIFACNAHAVYSDVAVSLAPGLSTIKVSDVDNEFHFAKRKTTGAWVNTGMFIQVWKAISYAKTYMSYDWVVKVDPDAVFVPMRLVNRIKMMPRTVSGVFLQNCRNVDYGFFGNLEVFSHQAFSILLANLDVCRMTLNWKVGIKSGKYGPMGEDLFAEICMEKNGVDKLEAFDVTTDGACEADRPLDQAQNKKWRADCASTQTPAMHPFKKPADYLECLDATLTIG